MFLAGPPVSGRTALLQQLAEELPSVAGSPRIISGRFVDGQYLAAEHRGANLDALPAIESALGMAAAAFPFLGVVAQAVSVSRAAAATLTRSQRGGPQPPMERIFQVLRVAARERPVVWLIDDCDEADGRWWSEVLLGLATEIEQELPLFVFLTVDAGVEAGPHSQDEPDALFAARHLTARGLAEWWPLPPVGTDQLAAVTGAADGDVLNRLAGLSEGRAGWAQALWDEWRTSHVVERDTDLGPWRFRPDQPDRSPTIADVARARVRRAVGSDPATVAAAWQVLGCAALEGRYFTAEAVATALHADRDDLIDLLDDRLASTVDREGLVEEVGSVTVSHPAGPERHVWRYRFTSQVVRSAFVRFGLSASERTALSGSLAAALEQVYGTESPTLAMLLAKLYREAGDVNQAVRCRRQAGSHMPDAIRIEQAFTLVNDSHAADWDRAQCERATACLIDGARLLTAVGALDQVVVVLRHAAAAAQRANAVADQADALMLLGATETYTGAPQSARSHLESAAALWRSLGRLDGEAESLKHLAWIDGLEGRRASALMNLDRSLELLRRAGLLDRVVDLQMHKANLALRLDDVKVAEGALTQASTMGFLPTPVQEAGLSELKGVVACKLHDFEQGLAHYERAAALYRDLGDRRQEASVTRGIGIALSGAGQHEKARGVLSKAIVMAQSTENIAGEAEARFGLGRVEVASSNFDAALREMRESLRLYNEVGQRHIGRKLEAEIAEVQRSAG